MGNLVNTHEQFPTRMRVQIILALKAMVEIRVIHDERHSRPPKENRGRRGVASNDHFKVSFTASVYLAHAYGRRDGRDNNPGEDGSHKELFNDRFKEDAGKWTYLKVQKLYFKFFFWIKSEYYFWSKN